MTAAKGIEYDVAETASLAARRKRRLEAFPPSVRRYIAELTSCARELEDLADAFPALLFAFVSGYGTTQQRARAFDLVCSGAPLRDAAAVLGLPWWLRRLPPQAFLAPIPTFPEEPEFALRITNLLPRDARQMPAWLARVGHALETGGPSYALWLARQPDLANPPEELLQYMAAWAWFSQQPGTTGHRLLRKPWTPDLSFKRGYEELAAWRQRLRLVDCLGPGIESPWLADGQASGLQFLALRTVEDFIAESEALENCLDQYADQLYAGLTAVFSIRRGERRIACVEIGLHDEEATMPAIVQLRGPRNRRAPPEVWQATFAWMGAQRLAPLSPGRHVPTSAQRAKARQQLWDPYLAHLAGTAHEAAFRQAIQKRARVLPRDRRRERPLQLGLVELGEAANVQAADTTAPLRNRLAIQRA